MWFMPCAACRHAARQWRPSHVQAKMPFLSQGVAFGPTGDPLVGGLPGYKLCGSLLHALITCLCPPQDDLIVRQCTGMFRFGYEYMGLNGRLVITALTDRRADPVCYMGTVQLLPAPAYMQGTSVPSPSGASACPVLLCGCCSSLAHMHDAS